MGFADRTIHAAQKGLTHTHGPVEYVLVLARRLQITEFVWRVNREWRRVQEHTPRFVCKLPDLGKSDPPETPNFLCMYPMYQGGEGAKRGNINKGPRFLLPQTPPIR